jgi:hypothetical protein
MVECLSDSVTGGNTSLAVLFWDGLACGNVVGDDGDNQSLPFDDPQKITRKEPRLHSWLVVIELIGEKVRMTCIPTAPTTSWTEHPPKQ